MFHKTILAMFFTALLAGCNATVGDLVKKTDEALDSLSTNGKPTAITKFQASAAAEQEFLREITLQAKLNGQIWWYTERKVKVSAKNIYSNATTASVPVAGGFRLALPEDALDARSASVVRAIQAMTQTIEKRIAWDPTTVYVSAQDDATRKWIESVVTGHLKNKTLSIAQEAGSPSIGWISTGLPERQL